MALSVTLIIYEHQVALLYRDGKYQRTLGPGRYRFWKEAWWNARLVSTYWWYIFDRRPTALNIVGQEILTKDKVPIRLTLAGTYRIADPVLAQNQSDSWLQRLYIDAQLKLRELVANKTFDEILEQKVDLGAQVRAETAPLAAGYGVELQSVAIKDITMPATIRDLMLKALEAEKSAQATLIKAREEVAAARARANAAKLLVDNPGSMRLKELETLIEVSKNPGNTIVFPAGLDLAGLTSRSIKE
jgi:regulator of protease activity HflC (stomatin/prohibitin superfamily)